MDFRVPGVVKGAPMQPAPPRRRPARPVADAPIDALLARTEDLAKGWLLALLEQAPLDAAPDILAADLARDGPHVCQAVVRALGNDVDLRRIQQGGTLELLVSQTGEFAGARTADAISCAVDALHAIVWSALSDELSHPYPEQISDLAQRLSLVTELVREAALRRLAGVSAAREAAMPPGAGAVSAARTAGAPGPPAAGDAPAVTSLKAAREAARERPGATTPATGERGEDVLWMGALEDEIVRAERAGTPLSLLLVELDDGDRVRSIEPPEGVAAILGRFAHAVRSAMRRKDILVSETDTRAWIVARDTGRIGAQALGARVVGAVRHADWWRGAPLTVSVGVAVLKEDGRDRAALIDAAEEARFAAAASGVGIIRAADEGDAPEPEA
jgi:GGDEF domain-containing protein